MPRSAQACNTKLPKLQLTKFSGDILKWRPFWDRFKTSVHDSGTLAPVDMFNYLTGFLEDEQLELIQSLPLTNENYTVACEMLQKRYGDAKILIAQLYRKLNEMTPVENDPVEIRKFVAKIDALMGSLGALGQNTSDDNFATIILSKLPQSTVMLLEMTKAVDEAWTITLVREKLSDYVTRLERSNKVSAAPTATKSEGDRPGYTVDSLFANEKPKPSKHNRSGQPLKRGAESRWSERVKCTFCGRSNHKSAECRTYPSYEERMKRVENRCFKCLRPNHMSSECWGKGSCAHCNKTSHHTALCKQEYGKTTKAHNKGKTREAAQVAANQCHDTCDSDSETEQQPQESVMLASGETVVL